MINPKIIAFGIFTLEVLLTFIIQVPGSGSVGLHGQRGGSAFFMAVAGILLIMFPGFYINGYGNDGSYSEFSCKLFGWIFLLGYLFFLLYFYLEYR